MRIALLAAVAMLSAGQAAHAATITYIFTGTASGSLGATPFTDASFTVTEIGDTTAIIPPGGPGGEFFAPITDATFTVDGSSGSLSGMGLTNTVVLNPSSSFPAIVFGQGNSLGGVAEGLINPAFETYGLAGPFPLTSGTPSFIPQVYVTSAGASLEFDSASSVSFQAIGGVPEPATWAVMLAGFGGLGAVMRGRRRAQSLAAIA
ncbi:MAG TPA: PEPxxWA-CTERM sorting domain-containing protein [Caulobacteraceae bacterium]|nr:PEPxxWA-CTERM sorting domain-containing protein [Caulobacteraceae bacterium]